MRWRSVLREARRNVVSGTSRAVVLALALMFLGLAAVGAELVLIARLEQEAQTFQRSGGSVMTVVAPGRVDGARCASLADVPGVRAAGALAAPAGEFVTAVALPGAPIPRGRVTEGFPAVLSARTDGGTGLVLAEDARRMLGVEIGDQVRTTAGDARVAGSYAYPSDGRRSGYGYLALDVVATSGTFDECWVDVWPQDTATRSLLLLTVEPAGGSDDVDQPLVAPLNSTHGLEFDGHARFQERVTQFGGVGAGVLCAVLGFVAIRSRRVELASALHDRMARTDLAAVVGVEMAVWVLPPALVSVTAGVVLFGARGDAALGAVLGLRVASLLALGAVVGVAAALAVTRERDLFAYAKDR